MLRMLDMLYWLATRRQEQSGGANHAAVAARVERYLSPLVADVVADAISIPIPQYPPVPISNAGIAAFLCQDLGKNVKQRTFLASCMEEDPGSRQSEQRKIQNTPSIEDNLSLLRSKSCHPSLKPDFEDKLNEIRDWVQKQDKNNKDRGEQIPIEDVNKVLVATIKSLETSQSQDTLEITRGVLDIISSLAVIGGEPYDKVIGVLCSIIGVLLTRSEHQSNVVDQLAQVVHKELVHFNKKLQDQKYGGLRRRVSDQKAHLRNMRPGEKLDHPDLWNDYVQFMGELSSRFESPLPFKYEDNLTEDPDVADFVTAVVTYCEAYCCFMALLIVAKGKFADLGNKYKEKEDVVDRMISCQREDAKGKLFFLSEERYLAFLGRLPYEDGKLTKIVALSRNMRAKSLVEAVRGSLNLPQMPNLTTVESAAGKVADQSVKVKVKGHDKIDLRNEFWWELYTVRFINETNFPMKIVSGRIGEEKGNLEFTQDVKPRESYSLKTSVFSTGGYIILYLNGILSSDTEPPAGDARVIEFALSDGSIDWSFWSLKINMQDKTSDEFTHGRDTYNKMKAGEDKALYWFESGMHFMAKAEFRKEYRDLVWRFVIQDFDPVADVQ